MVNPVGQRARFPRYSMPFFLHFRPDFLIEALESCVDEQRRGEVESPITAHDYLMQRLREINLV